MFPSTFKKTVWYVKLFLLTMGFVIWFIFYFEVWMRDQYFILNSQCARALACCQKNFHLQKLLQKWFGELQVNASEVKCIHGKMVGSVRRHKIIKHLTKYRVICQERDSVASLNRNAPSPTWCCPRLLVGAWLLGLWWMFKKLCWDSTSDC